MSYWYKLAFSWKDTLQTSAGSYIECCWHAWSLLLLHHTINSRVIALHAHSCVLMICYVPCCWHALCCCFVTPATAESLLFIPMTLYWWCGMCFLVSVSTRLVLHIPSSSWAGKCCYYCFYYYCYYNTIIIIVTVPTIKLVGIIYKVAPLQNIVKDIF